MNRRRVDLGNGEVEAAVAGDGPITVVFESGLGSPLEIWDGVVAPVSAGRAAAARYTNVDTSGHLMPIDSPDVVVDAIASVLDSLPLARTS
jgi:pimeloyl-ACP methyl ester carboxylesterase